MTELSLLNLSLITLFLPLLGFAILIFFGKRIPGSHWLETGLLFIALCISGYIAFMKLGFFVDKDIIQELRWITLGNAPSKNPLAIDLGIKIDNLTAIMLVVVNLISFLVHLFSIEYMRGDKRYSRYFAYLGIFTFSMLGIVLTHNILMMYIFWELVGLSSYLL
ncbi:MAG TPA: NADH-quinone oxidoreductase subunit L, partial [Ignavibacteriales bacterium]|nr:NADH-quinone oxidoreductase subunit L [Ignavibacteriales bacterium]